MPKAFPEEFRRVAVARPREAPMSRIAKDFGISESCLARWVKRAEIEDGQREGLTLAEEAEIRELKKRNAEILQDSIETDYQIILPLVAYVTSRFEAGRRFNGQFVAPLDDRSIRHFFLSGLDSDAVDSGLRLSDYAALQARIYQEDLRIVESQLPHEAPLELHGQ